MLQQQQQQDETDAPPAPPTAADVSSYVGVELCAPLAEKARLRLASLPADRQQVITADFLEPLPTGLAPFDSVVVCANTLFCTPHHDQVRARLSVSRALATMCA